MWFPSEPNPIEPQDNASPYLDNVRHLAYIAVPFLYSVRVTGFADLVEWFDEECFP